jgi:endogenous inhibitor of DNA gyrase (YacG/DUF329 family)
MKLLCPICRRPTNSETDADFPFCSERCRLVDLGNWSSEKYKISSPAAMDESENEESSQNDKENDRSGPRRRLKNTPQPDEHDD